MTRSPIRSTAWGTARPRPPTGWKGVETFARGHYDVVLTDLDMPRMDGRDVTRRVREARPDIGIVVVSADVSPDMPAPAWASGRVALVAKPASLEDLTAAIERVTVPAAA